MMSGNRVYLTRTVAFSSGHRYWIESETDEWNRAKFGKYASRYNHGHNYKLDVTIVGEVDHSLGMVVNIKRLDDWIRLCIVDPFDGKSLNDEVPEFKTKSPSVENILKVAADRLTTDGHSIRLGTEADGEFSEFELVSLRCEETPEFWGSLELKTMTTTLTRSYEFAAAHRLHVANKSEAENRELFGKCNNPNSHGHNYILDVTVEATVDPKTGIGVDLAEMDAIVEQEIVERYDHMNLDVDVPELATAPTTSENVALAIFDRLSIRIKSPLVSVSLHETARSSFEVRR